MTIYCPLAPRDSQGLRRQCADDCAWRMGEDCAVLVLARNVAEQASEPARGAAFDYRAIYGRPIEEDPR